MSPLDYIILGLVQGLTEFLPVSSSGHLVLTEKLLGLHAEGVSLEVTAHAGTLLAILVAFRSDIVQLIREAFRLPGHMARSREGVPLPRDARLVIFILLSMLPAAFVGIFLKETIASLFTPLTVLIMLVVTALLLLSTRFQGEQGNEELTALKSLLIGLAQAVAILPGISRSGSTVVAATWLGLSREESFRFSFLMSIPVVGGACLLQVKEFLEVGDIGNYEASGLFLLLLASAFSGYGALLLFRKAVTANTLHYFAYYCLGVSGLSYFLIS